MPFAFDYFEVQEPTMAFIVLLRRYNIEHREAQRIIARGRLFCNEETVEIKNKVISGNMKVLVFKPKSRGHSPIFKTNEFMVFDKPSGILVHPNKVITPYSMLDEVRTFGGEKANGVHRIDMETSGLFLASVNRENEIKLKTMFERKEIKKSYLAWVRGNTKEQFSVDAPIKTRDDYSVIKHKVEIGIDGKKAQTNFTKILYNEELDASLLHVEPLTGRTHQIRIHLFHMKHPILGDPIYGTTFETAEAYLEDRLSKKERQLLTGADRLMLHANTLEFSLNSKYFIKSRVDFRKNIEEITPKELRENNEIFS